MISKKELLYKLKYRTLTPEDIHEYSKSFRFEHDYLSRPNVLIEDVYDDSVFVTGVISILRKRLEKS